MFATAAFDLGLARRAVAALLAVSLVMAGATGWSYRDAPPVSVPAGQA